MTKKQFSKTIKILRKESGLSQNQFAEKLDVRRSTIQNWEYGLTKPSKSTVKMIIEKLSLAEYAYPELYAFVYSEEEDTESAEENSEKRTEVKAETKEDVLAENIEPKETNGVEGASPAEEEKEKVKRKLPPLAETAIIAASFWLFFAMAAIIICAVNYIATPFTSYTIIYYKKYMFADGGAIAMFAIFSFIAVTGIPILIRLLILLKWKSTRAAAALIAVALAFSCSATLWTEEKDEDVAYALETAEAVEEDVEGKATNIIMFAGLALCEGGGGKIIAVVTNDFTFFSSAASIKLSLYSSRTKTEDVSEMTLVSSVYSAELHSGKYLSVSAEAKESGYWLCRAVYYKSPSAEIFFSTPCFFDASKKTFS